MEHSFTLFFPSGGFTLGLLFLEYNALLSVSIADLKELFFFSLLFQNMSAVECKTEPDEPEPTTGLPDRQFKEEEKDFLVTGEKSFQVKEEEEEKKVFEKDEDILEFVIPGKCRLYVTIIECIGRSKCRVHAGL